MPLINKCRIVNFRYNNGKRLIADELFDFCNSSNNSITNTLIDMANGVGKTVMVQLMLQPIIPNASVSGRKIQTYFKNSSDHTYILLEWQKDNSNEKLLTGIALEAGEELVNDSESNNSGRKIKYYTFIANYAGNPEYDIANIELSKKNELKAFEPASYSFIRDKYKRHNKFIIFSSEENRNYGKKLAEFGILQTEWHSVMEKLNAKEGGISDFFEEFKNSDTLIDKLLIPTIERRIESNKQTKEDDSLETMLVNLSKKFNEQKKDFEELENYKVAKKDILNLKEEVDKGFEINSNYDLKLKEITGFCSSLKKLKNDLSNNLIQLESKLKEISEEEKQIKYEQISAVYYDSEEKFNEAVKVYDEAYENQKKAEIKLKESKKELAILEIAKKYTDKKDKENKIIGWQKRIEEANGDEDSKKEINNLKYTISTQLEKVIPDVRQRVADYIEQIKNNASVLNGLKNDIEILKKSEKENQTKYDSKKGELEILQKINDELKDKLEIKAFRFLGSTFDENNLLEVKGIKNKDKEKTEKSLEDAKKNLQINNEKIESNNQEIQTNKINISLKSSEITKLDELISDFYKKQVLIKDIYDKYSSDFDKHSTKSLNNYLQKKLQELDVEKEYLKRKLENIAEQLKAAENNNLHIPQIAIKFLNENNYDYESCEKYILNQVLNGNITEEKCDSIIKNNPSVAYALLMNENLKNKLLNSEYDTWLPFGIPVYSYEEMTKIINGEKLDSNILALYSKEYFSNPSDFKNKLKESSKETKLRLDNIISEYNSKKSDLEAIIEFEKQEKENEEKQEEQKKLIKERESFNKKLTKLEEDDKKLKEEQSKLLEEIEDLKERFTNFKQWLESFEDFFKKVKEEKELNALIEKLSKTLSNLSLEKNNKEKEFENLNNENNQIENRLNESNDLLSETEKVFNEVKDNFGNELIEGDWRDLYNQLEARLDSINSDIRNLNELIDTNQKIIEEYSKEIDEKTTEYGISFEDYSSVIYSDEKKATLKNAIENKESELEKTRELFNIANSNKSGCEAKLNSKKDLLKEFNNEPLPKEQIGSEFEKRLSENAKERHRLEDEHKSKKIESDKINNVWNLAESFLNELPRVEEYEQKDISKLDVKKEFEKLKKEVSELKERVKECKDSLFRLIEKTGNQIKEKLPPLGDGICNLCSFITNEVEGDVFFTLSEQIDLKIGNIDKSISRLETDLDDFKQSEETLIIQASQQAKFIINELTDLVNASKIKVSEDNTKQMLRINLPENSEEATRSYISDEIRKAKEEIASIIAENQDEITIRKRANKTVSNANLLRCYLNIRNLRLEAYKIDNTLKNSGYREWEATRTQNSGGEKFLAYFAVILSIINYNRKKAGMITQKNQGSVLILDNPFGPISSANLLDPMFDMAKRLRVQLICFSNITKADITSRFDKVIKAIVKPIAASSLEILTHNENEEIQHGFYRRELTLFG